MTAIEKVIAIAQAEIGYLEKKSNASLDSKTANAGDNNYTKYARDLDKLKVYNGPKNGYAWCAVFVLWCMMQAFGLDTALQMTGQKLGGYGAGCTELAKCYRAMGRFYKSDPKPGDQIFFTQNDGQSFYHTGLVVKVSGGKVYTVEGNTSSAAGVVDNGGAVASKSYSLTYSRIGGYGRPNYSLIQDIQEDDSMTQEKFNEMFHTAMNAYRKGLQDNDCGAWSKDARDWATSAGLITGGGNLTDGTPNYMWADNLTREQAAALFFRFAQMMGKA